MDNTDPLLTSLLHTVQDTDERAVAARYAPALRFDTREPFYPLVAGYTLFRESGPSPSFRQGHQVNLCAAGEPPATLAIEYAIWWDWDIGHLYELEHVWVYVDQDGKVVRGEASWHGDLHNMRHDGKLALAGNHLILYSEPGKHAFAPTPEWFTERRKEFKRSETSTLAGCSGVLITRFIEDSVMHTPLHDCLARTYLSQKAFEPSGEFSGIFEFEAEMLVPWPALLDWMPVRINHWLDVLARDIPPSSYRFWRIGHRGAAAHAPDNTLAGFRIAAELGADLVELDVQQTVDGQIAVIHDTFLRDETGHVLPVRETTLSRLQAVDLGGGERVPALHQALKVCREESIGAYIELKDGLTIPAVARALEDHDIGKYGIVGSFRPDWLAEFRAIAPHVDTSILFGSPHLDAVTLAQSVQATYVHPCWERHPNPSALLNPEWIARVRQAGLGILCWHEERATEIDALRRLGVDGICSDAPELLQVVRLQGRG